MQSVLIVIHLIIVVALATVVLLQRSEGGGLGLGGGGSTGMFTGRGQANLLTRLTAILGASFFATSIILSVIAARGLSGGSALDRAAPVSTQQAPAAPTQGQGVLDQLRGMQNNMPAAPAAPVEAPKQ